MKIKRIFIVCLGLFLLVGCTSTSNTPSKKVEDFLSKYQNLDDDVLTQLDLTLDSDTEMDEDQKKDYRALMEKQYQNLSYKITNEEVEDDTATVEVEVEVFDYQTSINKSKEYFDTHQDEFVTESDEIGNGDNTGDNTDNEILDSTKKYIDYKIKQLKDVTDKTTYTMTFNLTKDEDGSWILDDITDSDRQKLHGLY